VDKATDRVLVGLAQAIGALRAELVAAMDEGAGQGMQFTLDPIELTFQTVITKDADGKIGWKVLEVGGTYQSQTTQTLTLRLTPVWRDKGGRLVRDFTIADAQAPAGERYHAGPRPGMEPPAGS
jgi:hypothetical protein